MRTEDFNYSTVQWTVEPRAPRSGAQGTGKEESSGGGRQAALKACRASSTVQWTVEPRAPRSGAQGTGKAKSYSEGWRA